MQALHYLFLLVCTLFQLTYSSQDPFHYRGLGYLHQAEEISDCIVVTSSFPASASCLSPETGEPKWQITFRKDAFVVSFKAFERLSVFLVQSEGGRSFLYALLNRAGALLWELDLPLKSQLKATTLSFDSAINEISLITDGGVVVIGNALSTTPELHSTALNLDSCHVYPHSSTSTNRILGGCVSLKTGESSQIIFLSESKHLQLKPTEVTIPVITASILGNSVRAELKLDGKLKGSSSIDLSRFSTTQDANYEILTSDFFYNTEQDAKLIPTLYLMIRLLNPSKLLHIVVQSFKHDTKHELIDIVLEGEMKLVKSTHANLINAYNDFYFVQFQPTIAAHEKKEELRVTGQHVNDRITLFTLTLPRPLFSSLDSLSRIISLTPSNRRHVLLTLKSGVVLDINLNNEGRRHSSTVNWIRNDGLSHLQQPQVLHSSIHEQSSASEADQSSFVNKLSFQNIIQLFSTSSQYANCDLSRSVLAISRDEREKSFGKTGLAVHLVAIKPKFCGNVRIDTWYPILPTSVANDIVVESVQVVPLWDSSSAHTSASLIASGFDLIVSTPSGRTFVWHHKFSNVHGQFYWASASYDNHFQSLYPSSEFNVGKALLTPLSFNNFVGLLVGDSNHHEVITYQKSSLPNNQNYFFSVNRTSGSVMVEKLTSAECQSEDQTKCFVPVAVANINFDSTLEEIVLILRPNGHHAFNNRATTLGDDNILLNYINPNLAVVCTKSSTNAEKDESDSTLFINIIDVVSGKILHRVSHENVESPIRGVIIENFVLVSYWNGKAKRGEVSSIGLYDGFIGKSDFTPFGTESKAAKAEDHPNFYKVGNITRKSSFHTSAPLVMQRTYAFTRGIADLTQSISSRGINNKNLLIAFDSGQISSIDFRALSPRRPLSDPTQSEREEGLIKYNPFITIMPTSILTKSKYLTFSNSLRLLSTSAHLESESFVIAIGENGDLFVDVFTPAQPFDSLSSDFNHLALCALLVGLLVAVLLLRHFNRKSTLSRLWH